MKVFDNIMDTICCRVVHIKDPGNKHSYKCPKLATHFNGTHHFCKRHSRTGRFVVRDGAIGEILKRFDTEQELRDNIHLYPGMRMQKITRAHRRNLY